MRNKIRHENWTDAAGSPAGGNCFGPGFAIGWQNGPLGRGDDRLPPNGAFVEDVILAAQQRLEFYQRSRFACDENQEAIAHLGCALEALGRRTARREAAGVEGTHAGT